MSVSTSLTTFASLANDTSATTDLNNNFAAINTALTNAVALNGQSPNQMQSTLDMNSNAIINLPAPLSSSSPARLQDLSTITGGGTVTNIPVGGTTGQVLSKHSNTNYDVAWSSLASAVTGPGSSTVGHVPLWNNTAGTLLSDTAAFSVVGGNPVLIGNTTITGTVTPSAGINTSLVGFLGSTSGIVTTTSSTGTYNLNLPTTAGGAGTLLTSQGGGSTPMTWSTPNQLPGTATNDNASAGNIGEYITASVALNAVSITSGVPVNLTSISLTAGDWDVDSSVFFTTAGTTNWTILQTGVSSTSATIDATIGRYNLFQNSGTVWGAANNSQTLPPTRFSLNATTTIYLVASCVFTVSTLGGGGVIRARRVR